MRNGKIGEFRFTTVTRFFFSSRRRHTRWTGDWSSDVCSSDLSSPPEYSENRIAFQIELSPHGKWHACISWLAYTDGRLLPLESDCTFQDASDWDQRRVRFLRSEERRVGKECRCRWAPCD